MHKEMDEDDVRGLESYVDKYGLQEVLSKLSYICGEKATHIAENWQDTKTAKVWTWASSFLDRASAAVETRGV